MAARALVLLAVCLASTSAIPSELLTKRPHVLLIVADDYGWNDIGYHQNKNSSANPGGDKTTNGFIPTPNIDALAADGVKLENYYVQPLCSPTRGTIMSGRYPSHTGVGPDVIKPDMPYAMPKDEVLMPAVAKAAGYSPHMVGKWHLGFCDERYTPTFRGFDSFTGYLLGAEDYYKHNRGYNQYMGLDYRRSASMRSSKIMPAATNDTVGTYSTLLWASEVERVVKSHGDDTAPLFLYMAFQSVHEPLEAPQSYIDKFAHIKDKNRRVYAAMVSAMDDAIGSIVQSYKAAGLWNDTVVVFTTDNGGPLGSANNFPLRGHKATNWEGGVRGNAFVRGTDSDVMPLPRGETRTQLMHSTDWLPTIAHVMGASTSETQPHNLDGVNQWDVFAADVATDRKFIAHNVPPTGKQGAFRLGDYKLLYSGMQTADNTPQTPPPGFKPGHLPPIPKPEFGNTYVFNVVQDPTESHNLAKSQPDTLKMLETAFAAYQKTAVPDMSTTHKPDPTANPKLNGGVWGPFVNSTQCVYA